MKKYFLFLVFLPFVLSSQSFENQFSKPLNVVLDDIATRFQVHLKIDIDTVGKIVSYADFRIRPYSVEESLQNVLTIFDYKYEKQNENTFKLKNYEYMRRSPADGEKLLAYLSSLYSNKQEWETRAAQLKTDVRGILQIDSLLFKSLKSAPVYSKIRKYNGYKVQNFYLETLPGLYVSGSIYSPDAKGKFPLIVSPNGHWANGRYNEDLQIRKATLARMGSIVVDYDLFGWGESELQVGAAAHRTSIAHQIQILNGLLITDFMLLRKDVDTKRVGLNGGSGGGSQVVLLSLLDQRFTAACPTVSLASHFDGGCPCESGMPVSLAGGGTTNAELMAVFAPKPLMVISDGKDWTSTVPDLEYPYLQHLYAFYDAKSKVANIHLAEEGHTFGINKRLAVYEFFEKEFGLNKAKRDESKVTVEKPNLMKSFGEKGVLMPKNAIKNLESLEVLVNKKADRTARSNVEIELKAKSWVAALNLDDDTKTTRVTNVIIKHMKAVRDWHNAHPYTEVPAGMNPSTGNPLNEVEREVIANSAKPKSVHVNLMDGLRKDLSEDQVEFILDKYTIGKVAFTYKGYEAIVGELTPAEKEFIMKELKIARENAVDFKRMKGGISHMFEIHKTNIEYYFNTHGRDWRKMFKNFVDKRNAEKAANSK